MGLELLDVATVFCGSFRFCDGELLSSKKHPETNAKIYLFRTQIPCDIPLFGGTELSPERVRYASLGNARTGVGYDERYIRH